jgi:hypothetical protein
VLFNGNLSVCPGLPFPGNEVSKNFSENGTASLKDNALFEFYKYFSNSTIPSSAKKL